MNTLSIFFSGAFMMGLLVSGVFFLRFWKETSDRLFRDFAIAFFLLGFERIPLAMVPNLSESVVPFYLMRLAAFFLIAKAILRKNSGKKKNEQDAKVFPMNRKAQPRA